MKRDTPSYHGYRFPPEIISHAVWLYHRFGVSFRDGTVNLTKSWSIYPQDAGLEPVVNPLYWASETAISLNLTIPPELLGSNLGARGGE